MEKDRSTMVRERKNHNGAPIDGSAVSGHSDGALRKGADGALNRKAKGKSRRIRECCPAFPSHLPGRGSSIPGREIEALGTRGRTWMRRDLKEKAISDLYTLLFRL